MNICAILLMGGLSERFGLTKKQFAILSGKPIYEWALETFASLEIFSKIILVIPKGEKTKSSFYTVEGGQTRQMSSLAGLSACPTDTNFVMIHDAARPFLSKDIIKRHLDAIDKHQAINTCIPSFDAINCVEGASSTAIFDRGAAMLGQTPQTFDYNLIMKAHQTTKQNNAPDDCSLILELGHPVHIVSGDTMNFKITTPFDFQVAGYLMDNHQFTKH